MRKFKVLPPKINYKDRYWKALSNWLREEANWTCEACHWNFEQEKRYLHVHHISGRNFNSPENLEVLCIGCHAEQQTPTDHSFLKNSPDYQDYFEWKTNRMISPGGEDYLRWKDSPDYQDYLEWEINWNPDCYSHEYYKHLASMDYQDEVSHIAHLMVDGRGYRYYANFEWKNSFDYQNYLKWKIDKEAYETSY